MSQPNAFSPQVVIDMGEFDSYASPHRISDVTARARTVAVDWNDGRAGEFHYLWLRDNCACAQCRHPQTRERLFELIALPEDLPQPRVELTPAGALRVEWPAVEDLPGHVSLFDPGWLRRHAHLETASAPAVETWDAGLAARLPTVSFDRFMGGNAGLREWLQALVRFGVVLMTDGPTEGGEVLRAAERVGWPRESNFGRHFDVVSKPSPNNAAFTALRLEPHVDLPNWQRPPDFQLLYCLQNTATGGASLLTDGFAVVEALRHGDPEAFEVLTTQPIDFRFQDESADIRFRAPIVGLDADGRPAAIRFNNWIRDVPDLPVDRVEPFYRAYRVLWRLLRDPRFMLRFALKPGQMVAFDNLRVLHGREAFDPNSGHRHLQGTYLDRDLILSRLRVAARHAEPTPGEPALQS